MINWFNSTHLWPSSCVIVCANVIPLSSLTLHERSGLHIPPTFATPSVLFFIQRKPIDYTLQVWRRKLFATYVHPSEEQISLRVIKMATSWWFGSLSSFGFSSRCHLKSIIALNHFNLHQWALLLWKEHRLLTNLHKFRRFPSAAWVILKSGWASSSSSRTIRMTTTFIKLPMFGSLYSDETIFMIVSRYISTSPSWWNSTIDGSATTKASTCRGLLIDLLVRFCTW